MNYDPNIKVLRIYLVNGQFHGRDMCHRLKEFYFWQFQEKSKCFAAIESLPFARISSTPEIKVKIRF